MRANPTAQLLLFNTGITPDVEQFLRGALLERGVSEARCSLQSSTSTTSYLAVYHQIDIALDVFPCWGRTTTREALWMGVPVVAMYGDRRSARATAAALTQVGIPE